MRLESKCCPALIGILYNDVALNILDIDAVGARNADCVGPPWDVGLHGCHCPRTSCLHGDALAACVSCAVEC